MDEREEIIKELLKIYSKYEPKAVDAALRLIRSGEALRPLTELAEEVGVIRERIKSSSPSQRRPPASRIRSESNRSAGERLDRIIEAAHSGDAAHRQLAQMLIDARNGELLKSSAVVQQFATAIGLPLPSHRDRFSMLVRIGEYLLKLEADQLNPVLRTAEETRHGESSLHRWTNIIVRNE